MTGVTFHSLARAAACVFLAAAVSLPLAGAPAQDWSSIAGGDPVAGRDLVQRECGRCHAVSYDGLLVTGSKLTQDDIADRAVDRTDLLRAFQYERHPTMPKFLFGDYEMNNILAYFAQLRSGNAQQPLPPPWRR
jgi:mono/diheme cytochrome c family protein